MSCHPNQYTHVQYTWNDAYASHLSPLEALVYRSNTLGEDRRITNTGGGSTSVKVMAQDPANGQYVEIIWIKSAGSDLRASKMNHFSPLYQDKLVALRDSCQDAKRPGADSGTEATLAERIKAAAFNQTAPTPSVDTPLHALMPYAHVNHIHPSSAIAVGACKNSRSLKTEIWGDNLLWVPRRRPGFDQGIQLQEAWQQNPKAEGALLAGNGIATWSDDNKACYQQTLDIIEAASRYIANHDLKEKAFGGPRYKSPDEATQQTLMTHLLLLLRGLISDSDPLVATVDSGPTVMRFVNSADAPRLADEGVACLHHLRHTRLKPLYVPWDPESETLETLKERVQAGVDQYKETYRAYYAANCSSIKSGPAIPIRSAAPSVCLIPGLGMIAWGRSEAESRITAESYQSAIDVMRSAEAIDTYVGLPEREAFEIEYGCELSEARQ